MGTPICRKSDAVLGFCVICRKPTLGKIDTASDNVTNGSIGVARDFDIVRAAGCGHTGLITATSTTVKINGYAIATVGDYFLGDFWGRLINGSSNVTSS